MFTHYKKILACTLLVVSTISSMDNPPQQLNIFTVLGQNIRVIEKSIFCLNRIAELSEKDISCTDILVKQNKKMTKLLETNKALLAQMVDAHQNHIAPAIARFQNSMEAMQRIKDRVSDLEPIAAESNRMLQEYDTQETESAKRNTAFTYPEVTPFPIHQDVPLDIDQLVQDTENNIMRRIAPILEIQGNNIVTEAAKVTGSYLQDIESLTEEIEKANLAREAAEKRHDEINRWGYRMCTAIPVLLVCTVFITKYFFP